ncbi:PREDICTED: uncharacterized protein C1orf167 homolog isoform X2 [Crocodylus porosus]|uniref:uncharacterized protein C1orf167 homolog isoform X2 n=1 Tax=Crocodylus porosus TaxID=8502 RepID=UPI00093E9E2F|nr:PREDICTED: uncharacterized protein C1orf167 homolog isoform X2 [Crocodylus porosus]
MRKENVPPVRSGALSAEHKNVQKNVNIHLDPGTEHRARHWADAATVSVTPGWGVGRSRKSLVTAAAGKSQDLRKRDPSLVQTNLICPPQPFWDATGRLSNSCFQQQRNLCSRLQQRGNENVIQGSRRLPAALSRRRDAQQRCSRLSTTGLEGSCRDASAGLPARSLQEGVGSCELSCGHRTCWNPREGRNQSQEQWTEKQQHRLLIARSAGHGNLSVASADGLSPAVVSVDPSARSTLNCRPVVYTSSRGSSSANVASCCPGPSFTLEGLSSPSLAESPAHPPALRSLLESSQASASLHCSIQKLKQETAAMGILGSLPLESRSSPVTCRFCSAPDVSPSAIQGAEEYRARGKTRAAQARMKWGSPFAKAWGLGSVTSETEPTSIYHRYRTTELYTQRASVSEGIWSGPLSAEAGPVGLVDTEAGSPYDCSPYLGYRSQACGHATTHFPEEPSFRSPPCSVSQREDLPPSRYPGGLQVSLETQHSGAQMNIGVAIDGTPRKACVRVTSPPAETGAAPVQQLCIHSSCEGASVPHCKYHREPAELYDAALAAGKRPTVVNRRPPAARSSPSPLSVTVRRGSNEYSWAARDVDGPDTAREGGRRELSIKAVCTPPAEKSTGDLPPHEVNCQVQHVAPAWIPGSDFLALEMESSAQLPGNQHLLSRCLQAWSSHVLGKTTTAKKLYKQQLLRKGLAALQWAVQLRKTQLETAQQRCTLAMLAGSFHRWKKAMAKQSRRGTSQSELSLQTRDLPSGSVGCSQGPAGTALTECQLGTGPLREAALSSGVEGELWRRLHHWQRANDLGQRAQAIGDLRRLAAFRVWCLQKELLGREEVRASQACALLERKRLQSIFQAWRSRSQEAVQVWSLVTRLQRKRTARCFCAWKQLVEQKTLCKRSLEQHRAASLRKSFQQWVLILQLREADKLTTMDLFLLRRRRYYSQGPSSAARGPAAEDDHPLPSSTILRWPLRVGGSSLDDHCQRVKLQRIFLRWRARLHEQQQAKAFSRASEQRQLREALRHWHHRALQLDPLSHQPRGPPAWLDSEESSASSGFHSSTPAPPVSWSSLDRDSRQNSSCSMLAIEDGPCPLQHSSALQQPLCPPGPGELCGELYFQASFLPQIPPGRGSWFIGSHLQSLGQCSPDSEGQSLCSSLAWEETGLPSNAWQARCSAEELDRVGISFGHHIARRLLQKCFSAWATQTKRHLEIQQHHQYSQLARVFLSWHIWVVEDKRRKDAASRQYRLHHYQTALTLWKQRLSQRVEADRRYIHRLHQKATDTLRHWHKCWQRQSALRRLQQQWAQHSAQVRKRMVLEMWRCQAGQRRDAALCWGQLLLRRCLVAWWQATLARSKQREACSEFEGTRQRHLLALCFVQWRTEFLRAKQGEGACPQQSTVPARAFRRWRGATRGRQVLHLDSVAGVKQACNYWTKAAVLSQCCWQRSATLGTRKCRKMLLSWSTKQRPGRDRDFSSTCCWLLLSSCRRWLAIYRNPSRAERLPTHPLLERPGLAVGDPPQYVWTPESSLELLPVDRDSRELGVRYWRRWRLAVLLRQCREDRQARCLARAWLQWKDVSRAALLGRVLAWQRLVEQGWKTWRRRYLQHCVSQHFLEDEARSLLSWAFGRWRKLAASQCQGRGHR